MHACTHVVLLEEGIIERLEPKEEEESCACVVRVDLGYLRGRKAMPK
jgi:hypothetical protein